MLRKFAICVAVAVLISAYPGTSVAEKPRVFVLTDIENEPDDAMSMVRFLVYSNHYDIEGLVATTSIHQQDETAAWRIREIVEAYGQVRDNLERHEAGFPRLSVGRGPRVVDSGGTAGVRHAGRWRGQGLRRVRLPD